MYRRKESAERRKCGMIKNSIYECKYRQKSVRSMYSFYAVPIFLCDYIFVRMSARSRSKVLFCLFPPSFSRRFSAASSRLASLIDRETRPHLANFPTFTPETHTHARTFCSEVTAAWWAWAAKKRNFPAGNFLIAELYGARKIKESRAKSEN